MNKQYVLVAVLIGCVGGCGGDSEGPEMAPVSGTITLDGKPLTEADVFFVADGFEGFGKTKQDGSYSLVRGAPVGQCKVYISKLPEASGAKGEVDVAIAMDPEQLKAMNQAAAPPGAKPILPPEYSDPDLTKLSIEVPSGGTTTADFNL
ncbi:MAG: hypothetical protein RIK87_19770 [Fuerstiella sp.]